MKSVVWSSDDAPASHRHLAKFLVKGGFLPIYFKSSSADVAAELEATCGKLDPLPEPVVDDDPLGGLLG
jgi:hypothetical protein